MTLKALEEGLILKVLLCQSYLGPRSGEPAVFPLGLAYLASMIKEKHEVYAYDPNVSDSPMSELSALLDKVNPDVVGVSFRNIDSAFSFNSRSYYDPFVSMVKMIKEKVPSCKLIVGGPGFSVFAEEVMKRTPELDLGMISEGELSFSRLLDDLDHPERVKNVLVRKDDGVVFTGMGDLADFEALPLPSREIFDLGKYRDKMYAMGVQSKRGCSFGCTFCPNRRITGDYFRLRSPEKVADEIDGVVNDLGIDSFYFADAVFNYPMDHSRKLMQEIMKRKLDIRWQADFRPDFVNAQFMEESVKSGCTLFSFSPDGASDEAMRVLGKGFGVDSIKKTIRLARLVEGANVAYSFLYDMPLCANDNALGLLRLVPRIMAECMCKLRFVSLTKIRIYPHTWIYEQALREGKIGADTDMLHPVHYESGSSLGVADRFVDVLRGASILSEKACKKFRHEMA